MLPVNLAEMSADETKVTNLAEVDASASAAAETVIYSTRSVYQWAGVSDVAITYYNNHFIYVATGSPNYPDHYDNDLPV